jgi:adenylyl- and sulfurtransferase ThiI
LWKSGNSIMVEGPEPLGVAALIGNTPGVAWVAVGFAVRSFGGLSAVSAVIARKYLKPGDRFSVEAEGSSGVLASDVQGAVASGALEAVKGARVSQDRPKVRFRAAYDGSRGVVGIEARVGPGGFPTGRSSVTCLVSGGKHSSVVSWMALLAGYRLRLLHAKVDEEGMLEAARLYSELSHRTDPRALRLEVVEGGRPAEVLARLVKGSKGPVFGGFHPNGGEIPESLAGIALAPLFVMPEERFEVEFDSLSLKGIKSKMHWMSSGSRNANVRSFGGVTADISAVRDGLR